MVTGRVSTKFVAASVVAALTIQTAAPMTLALADEVLGERTETGAQAVASPDAAQIEANAVSDGLPVVSEGSELATEDRGPVSDGAAENANGDLAADLSGDVEEGSGSSASDIPMEAPTEGADAIPDSPEGGETPADEGGVVAPSADDGQAVETLSEEGAEPALAQAVASSGAEEQPVQGTLQPPVPGADAPTSPTGASTRAGVSIYDFLTQEQIDEALIMATANGSSEVSFASILAYADQFCGLPYVWGGKDPNVSGGFDCSGFVSWVLNNVAGLGIDPIYTNAAALYTDWCTPISREEAKPGDLVFFLGTYGGDNYISHVGIYLGNGVMIDAGDPVGYDSIDLVKAESGGTAPAVFGRVNGINVVDTSEDGWREVGDAIYYYENGKPVTGEKCIFDGWYYFDPKRGGAMATGITTITTTDGVTKTVCYDNYGRMYHGEANLNDSWYYFNEFDGTMATGITTIKMSSGATKTVCYGSDGRMVYGEANIGNSWYYFDTFDGTMATGLTTITTAGGVTKTVYYDSDGRMRYGEANVNGGWYYFSTFDGSMARGITNITMANGATKTVLYGNDGRMRYGEANINGGWYYFDEFDGHMVRGWKWISSGSKLVYYASDGRMVYGSVVIGGMTCRFNTFNGALVSPSLSYGDATKLTSLSLTRTEHAVPYVDQNAEGAVMGCEGASLYMALRGQGALSGVSFASFLNSMPRTSDNNPNNGFVGNPWAYEEDTGIYQSIYPAALASWGARYGSVSDISGTSTLGIAQQIQAGKNVVAYVTVDFEPVTWKSYFFGNAVENAHVVAVVGFDPQTARFLVADPNSKGGTQWISWNTFDAAYSAQKFAVAVG